MDELELFIMSFPVTYLKEVVMVQANKHLDTPTTVSELFTWMGCLFFMACHPGVSSAQELVVEGEA